MGDKQFSESLVLHDDSIAVGHAGCVELLQSKYLLFEGLDVHFLALSVRPGGGLGSGIWRQDGGQTTYLCACLLSSCLRVKAGLLSGLGPRRLGGAPSESVQGMNVCYKFVRVSGAHTFGLLLVETEVLQETKVGKRTSF
jgi:hypothetical protein